MGRGAGGLFESDNEAEICIGYWLPLSVKNIRKPKPICLRWLVHEIRAALSLAFRKAGTTTAAIRIVAAMMTINSTKVNANASFLVDFIIIWTTIRPKRSATTWLPTKIPECVCLGRSNFDTRVRDSDSHRLHHLRMAAPEMGALRKSSVNRK